MNFDELVYVAFNKLSEEQVAQLDKEIEKIDLDSITFSDRFKRKMNRVFREQAGAENIPHPEVDNAYERIHSRIVRFCLVTFNRIIQK